MPGGLASSKVLLVAAATVESEDVCAVLIVKVAMVLVGSAVEVGVVAGAVEVCVVADASVGLTVTAVVVSRVVVRIVDVVVVGLIDVFALTIVVGLPVVKVVVVEVVVVVGLSVAVVVVSKVPRVNQSDTWFSANVKPYANSDHSAPAPTSSSAGCRQSMSCTWRARISGASETL